MYQLRNLRTVRPEILWIFALAIFASQSQSLTAQQDARQSSIKTAAPATASVDSTTSMNVKEDEHYRIGPGDLLEIRFYNRPQLSGDVRVSMSGNIRLPLLDGDIQAPCKTEDELSKEIATQYLKYHRNQYVTVLVKEYSST